MQYILTEHEIKSLLLCRSYVQEMLDDLNKTAKANPNLLKNEKFKEKYKKYKEVLAIPHPWING